MEVVVVDGDFLFGAVGVDDGLGFSEEAFEGRADGFGFDGVAVGAVGLEGGAGEDFPVGFQLFVILGDPLFALGWGAGEGDGFWFGAGFGGEVDGLILGVSFDLSGGDGDFDFIDAGVDGDGVLRGGGVGAARGDEDGFVVEGDVEVGIAGVADDELGGGLAIEVERGFFGGVSGEGVLGEVGFGGDF